MNIRSITVERGIATLSHQTHLPTLLFPGSHSSRNTGGNVGASSVEAISSRTGVPAREEDSLEEWELEDDEEESERPGWFLERTDEDDENEAIKQVDRRIIRGDDDDV